MAKLPPTECATLAAADRAMEAAQDTQPRGYLGMSSLGMSCTRRLWLGFRWAATVRFDAATLKKFEDGYTGEAVMAKRLQAVRGIELHTQTEDGGQFGFALVGGHLRGHMDGAILGVLERRRDWLVWEHKQVGEDNYRALLKVRDKPDALKRWNSTYYAQAQMYMHASGMRGHFLTVATAGGREATSVITDADDAVARQLVERARQIITSAEPPVRVSDDPAYWECKGCPFAGQCHGDELPLVNCRTCAHATPELDGDARWTCAQYGADIPVDVQREGCEAHRWIPAMVARVLTLTDAQGNAVTWRAKGGTIVQPPWRSAELRSVGLDMATDPQFAAFKSAFPDSTAGGLNLDKDALEAEFDRQRTTQTQEA